MYRSRVSIAVLSAVFAASALALLVAAPVLARGGGGFRGGGGGFGGGNGFARPSPSFSPSTPGFRPDNRPWHTGDNNINTGDIDVNSNNGGWGWGWGSGAGLALGATAATFGDDYAAAPTMIYDLPPSCAPVLVNGTTYQNCDGTYYEPVYNGSSVIYQAVPAQ